MPHNLLPPVQPSPSGPLAPAQYAPALPAKPAGADPDAGVPWHRYLAALRRYKWLVMAVVLTGTSLGILGTRFLPREYETQATIWVENGRNAGLVRGQEILDTEGWTDLVKSFTVLDAVVLRHRLFVQSIRPDLFDSITVTDQLKPGVYTLQVEDAKARFTLRNAADSVVESGTLPDSVGRTIGLRWRPDTTRLPVGELRFGVTRPRQAAMSLFNRLAVELPENGSFMRLRLTGDQPERVTRTLNSIADEFVVAAADLKAFKLRETSRILEDQVGSVGTELRKADARLESYKTQIITLPTEATPVTPGLQMTQSPVINAYFGDKITLEGLLQQREALRAAAAQAQAGSLNAAALQQIVAVREAPQLMQSLQDLSTAETDLRALLTTYTEQAKPVLNAQEKVSTLRNSVVPEQIRLTLASLDGRIAGLQARLATATKELQAIPTRMITEQRLERERQSLAAIFTDLQARYQAARLAEATAIPDVKILDRAVQPTAPTRNSAPRLLMMAFVASVGLALGLAVLLDRLDKRVQYPEQVSEAMGLAILGAVPAIKKRRGQLVQDDAAQFIEAFRTIRVNLAHSFPGNSGLRLTISSPSAGDGKSLVASNLAVSFASAGYQTLLIDGDTRRGELHRMFGTTRRPGLLDYLQGEATLEHVVRPTAQPGLWVVPCGTRRQHGPELLGSGAMQRLLEELGLHYNVVLIDSPPLGAGVDPFVLGAATGNMMLVVRSGETDRHLAEAKLSLVDRLPIRVIGAVLNDVRATGAYRYYSYLYGYSAENEEEPAQVGPESGGVSSA